MYRQNKRKSKNRPFRGGKAKRYGRGGGRRSFHKEPKPLDVSLLINKVDEEAVKGQVGVHTRKFSEIDLPKNLQQNIDEKGFTEMTEIQDACMNSLMAGNDLLGIANTGTGKTSAFLIPILSRLMNGDTKKVLILAPTRELALQINREFISLRDKTTSIYSVICIGGTNMNRQVADLRRQYQVIIGTPGRVKDLMEQELLPLQQVGTVVLDEVDRMLDMGFVHDMRSILRQVPTERQSMYFSATVSEPVKCLISEFSSNYETVSVKQENTAKTIDQDVIPYRSNAHKRELLETMLSKVDVEKVLIFGRTKHGVKRLAIELSKKGFRSESIHGNKSQNQRIKALTRFRRNEVRILVATDVAARGLDIDQVTHVINYDMPASYDDYVHRIGRTGRAQAYGKALTFVQV